jgi:hypothetical protein
VVLFLGACSSAQHRPVGTVSGSSAATDPRDAGVLGAYNSYWAAVLASSRTAKPDPAALVAYTTGVELNRAKQVAAAHAAAGEYVAGSYAHRASVTAISATAATVRDCLTVRTATYDDRTHKRKANAASGPYALSTQMSLDAGHWKVREVTPTDQPCSTPPAPTTAPRS